MTTTVGNEYVKKNPALSQQINIVNDLKIRHYLLKNGDANTPISNMCVLDLVKPKV